MSVQDTPTTCPLCGGTESVRRRHVSGYGFYVSCLPCYRPFNKPYAEARVRQNRERYERESARERDKEARAEERKREAWDAWEANGCAGCRFFAVDYDPYEAPTEGECRKNAPLAKVSKGTVWQVWPPVFTGDSCGEREAKT